MVKSRKKSGKILNIEYHRKYHTRKDSCKLTAKNKQMSTYIFFEEIDLIQHKNWFLWDCFGEFGNRYLNLEINYFLAYLSGKLHLKLEIIHAER